MIDLRFESSCLLLVNKSLTLSDVIACLGSGQCLLVSGLVQLYLEQETAGKCHRKLLGLGAEGFENVEEVPQNCYKFTLRYENIGVW
jgi:hypothetical protein